MVSVAGGALDFDLPRLLGSGGALAGEEALLLLLIGGAMISSSSWLIVFRRCFWPDIRSVDSGCGGNCGSGWDCWGKSSDILEDSAGVVGTSSGPSLRFFEPELGGFEGGVRSTCFCFGKCKGEFSSSGSAKLPSVDSSNPGSSRMLFCRLRGLMPFKMDSSRSGVGCAPEA